MPRPTIRLNLKLLLVAIACIGVYVNLWKVHSETHATRAIRDVQFGSLEGRRAAALSLGESILEEGVRVIPVLARAATADPDEQVRFNAIVSLGDNAGPNESAVDALIISLKRGTPQIRSRSAQALSGMAILPQVPPALIAALKDEAPEVRAEAASALGLSKEAWEEVEVALVAASRDADPEVRARVLGSIHARSKAEPARTSGAPIVPSIIATLTQAVSRSGRWAARYQAAMLDGLKDPSVRVRRAAARGLAEAPFFGFADATSLTDAEIASLSDVDPEVRINAATSLGVPRKVPRVPGEADLITRTILALISAFGDADERVHTAAVAALRSMYPLGPARTGEEDALIRSALVKALDGPMAGQRRAALLAAPLLAASYADGPSFLLNRYEIASRDRDAGVRLSALNSRTADLTAYEWSYAMARSQLDILAWHGVAIVAGRLKVEQMLRLPRLVEAYLHARAVYRGYPLEGLDPMLRLLCDDPDPHVRRIAYTTLWRFDAIACDGDRGRRAVLDSRWRGYLRDLSNPSAIERDAAAWALQWVPREHVRETLEALRARRDDDDRDVRIRVAEAIDTVDPRSRKWHGSRPLWTGREPKR